MQSRALPTPPLSIKENGCWLHTLVRIVGDSAADDLDFVPGVETRALVARRALKQILRNVNI